jgi:hypothetical protein
MNNKSRGDDLFQGMGWVVGGATALLLISDGLALLAQQASNRVSMPTLLLALYLAPWLYGLGLVGLGLLSMWQLVGWLRGWVKQATVSRYFSAEPRSRPLERPEWDGVEFLQQDVAPVVPSRSSLDSDNRNETTETSRVA